MKIPTIALSVLIALAATGCHHQSDPARTPAGLPVAQQDEEEPQAEPELVPVLRKAEPPTQPRSATTTTARATTAPKPATATQRVVTPDGKKIYVETDGAQGRVWGYVTLNGDRGTGTIHDWDENTLSVSVVRHGDELFAVDQNSRQYVFKLKK